MKIFNDAVKRIKTCLPLNFMVKMDRGKVLKKLFEPPRTVDNVDEGVMDRIEENVLEGLKKGFFTMTINDEDDDTLIINFDATLGIKAKIVFILKTQNILYILSKIEGREEYLEITMELMGNRYTIAYRERVDDYRFRDKLLREGSHPPQGIN